MRAYSPINGGDFFRHLAVTVCRGVHTHWLCVLTILACFALMPGQAAAQLAVRILNGTCWGSGPDCVQGVTLRNYLKNTGMPNLEIEWRVASYRLGGKFKVVDRSFAIKGSNWYRDQSGHKSAWSQIKRALGRMSRGETGLDLTALTETEPRSATRDELSLVEDCALAIVIGRDALVSPYNGESATQAEEDTATGSDLDSPIGHESHGLSRIPSEAPGSRFPLLGWLVLGFTATWTLLLLISQVRMARALKAFLVPGEVGNSGGDRGSDDHLAPAEAAEPSQHAMAHTDDGLHAFYSWSPILRPIHALQEKLYKAAAVTELRPERPLSDDFVRATDRHIALAFERCEKEVREMYEPLFRVRTVPSEAAGEVARKRARQRILADIVDVLDGEIARREVPASFSPATGDSGPEPTALPPAHPEPCVCAASIEPYPFPTSFVRNAGGRYAILYDPDTMRFTVQPPDVVDRTGLFELAYAFKFDTSDDSPSNRFRVVCHPSFPAVCQETETGFTLVEKGRARVRPVEDHQDVG